GADGPPGAVGGDSPLGVTEREPIAAIARRLDLDRKTIRRCLRDTAWQPYHRSSRPEKLLMAHAEDLRERAEQVEYSGRSCCRSSASAAVAIQVADCFRKFFGAALYRCTSFRGRLVADRFEPDHLAAEST